MANFSDLSKKHQSSDKISTNSSLYDYECDYEIEINIDRACKNRLMNNCVEDDHVFALKNDFFVNYGNELFLQALKKYNDKLNTIDNSQFNENLWNKCVELFEISERNKKKSCFWFAKNSRQNTEDIKTLYSLLSKMQITNIKMKTWIQTKNIILGISED